MPTIAPRLPTCLLAKAVLYPSFVVRKGERVPVIAAHVAGLPEFKAVVMPEARQ